MPRPPKLPKFRVTYPGSGILPQDCPVLEYRDGPKFYQGDIWVCPSQTPLEIEQSLINRGYLVEVSNG